MKKPAIFVILIVAALLVTAVIREHQANVSLKGAVGMLQTRMQELTEQVVALQNEKQRAVVLPATSMEKTDDRDEWGRLRGEVARLQERLAGVERANAGISNEIAVARGANIPFVYPDSTKRKDYAFTGYATPQSGFQSALWAITQMDAKAFLSSVTGQNAEMWAEELKDLPDGVMPGGFRNGAMFKATGFRIVEETPASQDEVHLKVFLEGSRITIKPVLQRVGGEWKWARNDN